MADDTSFRSNRSADPRWPGQAPVPAGREAASDPLAELARLIGQTDPFADANQGVSRAQASVHARPVPAAAPPQRRQPAPSDPYGSPLQFSEKRIDSHEPHPRGMQPAYDPSIYATQQQTPGHPPEAYYDDPAQHGDEGFEEDFAEPRPRRGLKLILAGAALLVIGTSGVLGYRAIFSNGSSGPPPVIKANTAPSKIVPAPSAEASNKQIYDRVGDPSSQGERVVSREEKPVAVKDTSPPQRMVISSMLAGSNAPETAMAVASPPLNTDPGGPASAEPKKIRTVTIRPEGTGSTPAPRPNSPPSRPAAEPAMAVQPASQGSAPLSLSPQVASAEASAPRSAFPPPPKPAAAAPARVAAVAPATDVAGGAYTVQISSQRSETEAQTSFRNLQAKFPSILGDRQPIIRRADLGDKGIYFRAMVGPFASVDQATQFCGSLKSAGGQCVVQRN